MRIVFLGTGEIGVPSLRALAHSHEVVAVVTQPDRPAGRDMKLRPSPIKALAAQLQLPVLQPEKIRRPEVIDELRTLGADLFVVVAYGQILPLSVLEIPYLGCLNVHASLLPRHRGASPIQAAILSGDPESGVTIMQMDQGLDTGDILLQEAFPLGRHETGGSLHDRLATQAPALLQRVLADLFTGKARRQPQDSTLATYAPKLSRDDGRIDWTRPALELDRRIRAFTPWPGSSTLLPDKTVLKVHRVAYCRLCQGSGQPGEILRTDHRGILVSAGEGTLLLREIQAPGGKRMPAADFLRGRPLSIGTILG